MNGSTAINGVWIGLTREELDTMGNTSQTVRSILWLWSRRREIGRQVALSRFSPWVAPVGRRRSQRHHFLYSSYTGVNGRTIITTEHISTIFHSIAHILLAKRLLKVSHKFKWLRPVP